MGLLACAVLHEKQAQRGPRACSVFCCKQLGQLHRDAIEGLSAGNLVVAAARKLLVVRAVQLKDGQLPALGVDDPVVLHAVLRVPGALQDGVFPPMPRTDDLAYPIWAQRAQRIDIKVAWYMLAQPPGQVGAVYVPS